MFNSAKIKTVKTKMRMLRVSENENGHFSREKYSRNIRLCSPFWRINLPNPGKGRRKEKEKDGDDLWSQYLFYLKYRLFLFLV